MDNNTRKTVEAVLEPNIRYILVAESFSGHKNTGERLKKKRVVRTPMTYRTYRYYCGPKLLVF